MVSKTNKPQIFNVLGFLLTIFAFAFIGRSIWRQKEAFSAVSGGAMAYIALAGVPLFLAANFLLALAWRMMLGWFGETRPNFQTSVWIYGKAQILKYIPGNLLSLPGRHWLGMQHGAKHGPLAGAALFEFIGLFAAASGVSVLGLLLTENGSAQLSFFAAAALLLASLASPPLLKYALSIEFVVKKLPFLQGVVWGRYSSLLAIWSLYLCFFALAGFVAQQIIVALTGGYAAPFYVVFVAFTISWLAGTITPGAPAGAGIRESAMILILSNHVGEPVAILVSLAMRLVTMFGDAAFYLISLRFSRKTDLENAKIA